MAHPKPDTDTPAGDMPPFSDYAVRDPEAFARNMARMLEQLVRAASAWVEPRERGDVQEGLRGNAAAVQADAARIELRIDERNLHPEIRGIERRRIAKAGVRLQGPARGTIEHPRKRPQT